MAHSLSDVVQLFVEKPKHETYADKIARLHPSWQRPVADNTCPIQTVYIDGVPAFRRFGKRNPKTGKCLSAEVYLRSDDSSSGV